jgi:GNAT superfamily N-acetyltransferase
MDGRFVAMCCAPVNSNVRRLRAAERILLGEERVTMQYRIAIAGDYALLAELNSQLIRDEGHRNPMTTAQLEERLRGWLASGAYQALLFEEHHEVVAYALFRETEAEVYLRQFFVVRHRRGEGLGRRAMHELFTLWPRHKRWTVSVLVTNVAGIAFWRAMGYTDDELTLEIMPRV